MLLEQGANVGSAFEVGVPDDVRSLIGRRELFFAPVALILFVAASLKAYQLQSLPFLFDSPIESRTLNVLAIVVEYAASVWLITQIGVKYSRVFAILMFFVFLLFALRSLFRGESSCGCFGNVTVHPVFTVLIDIFALILLVNWNGKLAISVRQQLLVSIVPVVMSVVMIGNIFAREVVIFDGLHSPTEKSIVLLEPSAFSGKSFPLADYLTPMSGQKPALERDHWKVVFVRDDCPDCDRYIRSLDGAEGPHALVLLPPIKSKSRTDTPNIKWFMLSDEFDWFAQTPLIVELHDGVVTP